tara:strand:- start:187 stop:330 length:144 start_codon:yes stop_codon:yes gene_type:complete
MVRNIFLVFLMMSFSFAYDAENLNGGRLNNNKDFMPKSLRATFKVNT